MYMSDEQIRWAQLWVTLPDGGIATPERMRHADQTLNAFGAMFSVPPESEGLPVADEDGSYEVRVLGASDLALGMVRRALTEHEGLSIVREEIHDF